MIQPFVPRKRLRYEYLAVGLLTLAAFALRIWQLDTVPPGWRDDELINSLVISQKVLAGDWAVYYADASGHEALYHILNAAMLGLFGPGIAGIRWLSVILGTLTIPLTYLVGRRLFGPFVGLTAAAMLMVSFWSLMYSRIGIRHIALPVFALATFYMFLTSLESGRLRHFIATGLLMGLGFYTYFASRGLPLILLAYLFYIALFARPLLLSRWRGLLITAGIAVLLAIPLVRTLGQQPEAEARVAELAVPLVAAQAGNFAPLRDHITITLNMFHADGDNEWLYNIPHRPLFGPLGAVFFWSGVLIALWYALLPFISWLARWRGRPGQPPTTFPLSAAFVLLWWLAGISPGFISVPPASLGHTILAQTAVYILAALPLWWLWQKGWQWNGLPHLSSRNLALVFACVLIVIVAWRDLPDYFVEWPQRGMVRFLYRADIADVAAYLREEPSLTDVGITGLLAGPWDKIALETTLTKAQRESIHLRWVDPQRALLLSPKFTFAGFPEVETAYEAALTRVPDVGGMGGYRLFTVTRQLESGEQICFENGLCWATAVYDPTNSRLELGWQVARPLQLPPMPLISNPPPPGIYSGPRLAVFAQLQDSAGQFIVGDDGLWVDPTTLLPGDQFVQQHWLEMPQKLTKATAVFGLYDPKTGERLLTTTGQDHISLPIETITK